MVALSHTYITLIPVKIISINELWELMVVFSSYLSSFGFYWIGLCDILLGLNSVSVKLNVFFFAIITHLIQKVIEYYVSQVANIT